MLLSIHFFVQLQNMQRKFIIFLVLQVTLQTSCVRSQCDVSNQDCIQLFRKFQEALFNNTNNLFVLQSVFYPPTQITPVLVKVIYKLNTNIFCQGREIVDCHIYQPTVCDANGSYTFGWTNRGMYKIFHASIINQLRFQLPFLVLQISEDIHNLTEEYDVDAFLWDGEMQLPSVNLSLTVDLPINEYDCICDPLKYPIEPALGELTEWVSLFSYVSETKYVIGASLSEPHINAPLHRIFLCIHVSAMSVSFTPRLSHPGSPRSVYALKYSVILTCSWA